MYQLRERRCANTSYKFNEYDDMINAAIQDEVEAVQGAGNQGRGKDISTIVNAEKEEQEVMFYQLLKFFKFISTGCMHRALSVAKYVNSLKIFDIKLLKIVIFHLFIYLG